MCAVGPEFHPTNEEIEAALPGLRIVQPLGAGGQKVVFVARYHDADVALKLIRPGPASILERARREIDTLRQLNDPHFPRIFESGECALGAWDGVLYIIEELLHGESLRERLGRESPIPLREAFRVTIEILGALVILERVPIVHRDIKPENVFLEAQRVVLLDFGIIRHLALESLTHDLAMVGPCTPGYGAPEQIRNEKRSISTRTDLFALGVVIYEMVSGINPFADPDPRRAIEKTLRLEPPPLSSLGVGLPVSMFVERCLQKSPHRRIPSAAAALNELRRMNL